MPPLTRVFVIAGDDRDVPNLARIFSDSAGFTLVGSAVAGDQLKLRPGAADVIVAKVPMREVTAFSRGTAPILLLVSSSESEIRENGSAVSVLSEDSSLEQIKAATLAVAAGLHVGPAHIRERAPSHESDFTYQEPLTDREIHVLNLIAEGLSNPEIAKQLGISRNTVKFHVSSIIAKLGAASRTEAVSVGVKRGLIIL